VIEITEFRYAASERRGRSQRQRSSRRTYRPSDSQDRPCLQPKTNGSPPLGSGNRQPRERTLAFLAFFCALPKRLNDRLKTSGELAKEVDH
jgi:hypothetical protein